MSIRSILILAAVAVSAGLMVWVSLLPDSPPSSAKRQMESQSVPVLASTTTNEAGDSRDTAATATALTTSNEPQPAARISYDIRISQLQAQVNAIPAEDLPSAANTAIETLRVNPTPKAEEFMLRLLQRWAETDPSAAAERLETVPDPEKTEAIQRVIQCWATHDISSAAAWINRLTDSTDRHTALLALAQSASLDKPTYALALASQSILRREDFDIISQAASTWAATSPDQAARWSSQINDPDLRQQVSASIAASWADQDPVAAAQWLLSNEPNWEHQRLAVFGIAQRLALTNPTAATRWTEKFPEELRDSAKNELKRISERREMAGAPK